MEFKALRVFEKDRGYALEIQTLTRADLPDGDVLVRVHYSSLNYKDALSASGNKGVTRVYPHTPGIDAAGVVEVSSDAQFKPHDQVIVNGFDLGMNTDGGLAEYIRVPASWVVRLPEKMTLKQSMMYGTAGMTAALLVNKLIEAGVSSDRGDVLVTGATGGVGVIACRMLSALGYRVIASTGKIEFKDTLLSLGVSEVIHRKDVTDDSNKPILKPQWAAAVDTVGGKTLADVLRQLAYNGVVATCGNVGGHELNTTVYPFILRGISLLGVDAVMISKTEREAVWQQLSELDHQAIQDFIQICSLEQVPDRLAELSAGKHAGRTVVQLHADE